MLFQQGRTFQRKGNALTYYRTGRIFAVLIPCAILLMAISPISAFAQSEQPLISNISLSVTPRTPLYKVEVDVRLSSTDISCPAKLTLKLGPIPPQTKDDICGGAQTAPADVPFLLPVFDPDHPNQDLTPGKSTTAQASITDRDNQDQQKSVMVAVPPAPIGNGIGDSYSSGHHQDKSHADVFCANLSVTMSTPRCDFLPNQEAFSWVTNGGSGAVALLNSQLKVPADWKMTSALLAKSGATTLDMEGQVPAMNRQLLLHRGSWNVVSINAGGGNDIDFAGALAEFYKGELGRPNFFPWNVPNSEPGSCVDTDSLYSKARSMHDDIRLHLQFIVTQAMQIDRNVRIVDVGYPFVMKTDNICAINRKGAFGATIYGATAVVNELNTIHMEVTGNRIVHIDLRKVVGNNPLSDLQLIEYYGYPHPNAKGQNAIASAAVNAVIARKF